MMAKRITTETDSLARQLTFEEPVQIDRGDTEPSFLVDVDGFEGPLDLLLELARRQKVDLHKISVLALAEQYLSFIEAARRLRLELAADYLVMAAWLAYLKSRLLLPQVAKGEEPAAADLAAALALRLRRLEAMREAANRLTGLPQLGRDVFARGEPQPVHISKTTAWQASLYDLLSAYARQRQKNAISHFVVEPRVVWSLAQAREALQRLAGVAVEWTVLDEYLRQWAEPQMRRTVRASAFSAALEMVREGHIDLRQDAAFAPLWIRARKPSAPTIGIVA
jgi:segregation and condensation protein A